MSWKPILFNVQATLVCLRKQSDAYFRLRLQQVSVHRNTSERSKTTTCALTQITYEICATMHATYQEIKDIIGKIHKFTEQQKFWEQIQELPVNLVSL
jgi:TRAP-type mannitol/chloroaromatic compound transport system substrate-binding protein